MTSRGDTHWSQLSFLSVCNPPHTNRCTHTQFMHAHRLLHICTTTNTHTQIHFHKQWHTHTPTHTRHIILPVLCWQDCNNDKTMQKHIFCGPNVVNPGTIEYTAVWMDNVNDRRWKASPFSAVPVCCSIRIRFSFLLFWWYNSSGTFVIKNYAILNKRNNLMQWTTSLATREVLFISDYHSREE